MRTGRHQSERKKKEKNWRKKINSTSWTSQVNFIFSFTVNTRCPISRTIRTRARTLLQSTFCRHTGTIRAT
jgi:hypothetical protein